MKPDFAISANKRDITRKIQDRLLSLNVKDEAGLKSDALTINLDDRDHKLELPKVGAELEFALGYQGDLVRMGKYVVDNITLSSPPATMVISAKAANFISKGKLGGLQSQRSESWPEQTFEQLVNKIAERHDYKSDVAKELKNIELDHGYQTEESDINYLLRQALEIGVVVKVMNNRIICVKEKSGEKINGEKMPKIKIAPFHVNSWNVSISHREKFSSVETKWYNKKKAKMETYTEGDNEPIYQHTQTYSTEKSAKAAAKALLKRYSTSSSRLSITMPGNVEVSAERVLELKGFREGVDGTWICESATHSLSSSGFSTSIKASIAT